MIITLIDNKVKYFSHNNKTGKKVLILSICLLVVSVTTLICGSSVRADTLFRLGEEGEEIERLQQRLSELDFYDGSKTGFFGEQTQRAVEQFQDAAALSPDGAAGPETISALEISEGRKETYSDLKLYSRGPEVILAQYILHQQDFLRVSPTGLFRSLTEQAVKDFQREQDIDPSGIIGQQTWEYLLQYETPKDSLNFAASEVEEAREEAEQETSEVDEVEERQKSEEEPEETAREEQVVKDAAGESAAGTEEEIDTQQSSADRPVLRSGDRGENVKEAQQLLKTHGFYQSEIDGMFGHQMELAVIKFQKAAGLQVDGVLGPKTWENLVADNGEISRYTVRQGDTLWELASRFDTTVDQIKSLNNLNSHNIRAGDNLQIPGAGQAISAEVKEMDWWNTVDPMFPRNDRAIITDVKTGLSFEVKRYGGTNHADVEPLTSRDTQILRRIYGGSWSWDRRAVVVHIGRHLIAGSINGTPHGGQQIQNNNFPGHICLHFNNSKLHNNGRQDPEHQNNVDRVGEEEWPVF